MFSRLIRQKYKIVSMAYSRAEFKNKLEEKIGGAFYEFLKAELAKVNKETHWVMHWHTEVNRLLDTELVVVLLHTSSFKNRKKAAEEVVNQFTDELRNQYLKSAKLKLENNYFKKKFNKSIAVNAIDNFFKRVQEIIEQNT